MDVVLTIASYAKAQPAALAWTFGDLKVVEREVSGCYLQTCLPTMMKMLRRIIG